MELRYLEDESFELGGVIDEEVHSVVEMVALYLGLS